MAEPEPEIEFNPETFDELLTKYLRPPPGTTSEEFAKFMNSEMTLDKYLKIICCKKILAGPSGEFSQYSQVDSGVMMCNMRIRFNKSVRFQQIPIFVVQFRIHTNLCI